MGRLLLAQGLAVVGSLKAAEKEYRDVLAPEPDNAKALRGVGFCRLRPADYAGAVNFYDEATGPSPATPTAGRGWARPNWA